MDYDKGNSKFVKLLRLLKVSLKSNILTLGLFVPVKLYLQENFISIKTVTPLLYENEKFLLKFNLNTKNLHLSNISHSKSLFKTFFSFWKIII